MPNQVQIHNEFVVEIATEVEINQETHVSSESAMHLVDSIKFCAMFRKFVPDSRLDPKILWCVLLGINLHAESDKKGSYNPHVRYLTTDSFEQIIKHRFQFSSGIDFQHLPSGFYLAKNSQGGGVCDVLHYNEYYAQFQPKDDANALAITLMTPEQLREAELPDSQTLFSGAKAQWYSFLQNKRRSDFGNYCTEAQLIDAFICFSNLIQRLGLEYYPPQFDENLVEITGNPIVILGRWATVLSNPHLKLMDRQKQWQALPHLALIKSHEAIRAITDYACDQRPCGFILPEMQLTEENCDANRCYEFRPEDDEFKKVIKDRVSFWRYIAYQPKRASIEFYEKALERLEKFEPPLSAYYKNRMIQILSASTVGFNYAEDRTIEEELTAWNTLCEALVFNPGGLFGEFYTHDVINHLYRLAKQPNISFLKSIAEHIRGNIVYQFSLIILSNRLSFLILILGQSFYQGSTFYFEKEKWEKLAISSYVDLLYDFYKFVGGQHTLETINDYVGVNLFALKPQFALLAPHLSTFNLCSIEDIQTALSTWPQDLCEVNMKGLVFCFELFNDIKINKGLTPKVLAELISAITTNDRLQILSDIRQRFERNFEAGYFEKKEKQIRDMVMGLTPEQIVNVKACSFPEAACNAIISFESAIVQQSNIVMDGYLAAINDQLLNLKPLLIEDDFVLFVKQLDDMREAVASNHHALPELIQCINAKRTLEGFNQIYVRNEIEKSKENLLEKFILFIKHVKPLTPTRGLSLNTLGLEEILATLVLNTSFTNFSIENYLYNISELIQKLNHAAQKHPHIKHYLLESINHITHKNTEAYQNHVFRYADNVKWLSDILSPEQPKSMLVIYSLLANFHKKPTELNDLLEEIRQMPEDKAAFMLTFFSRLIDNKQSIMGYSQLIQLLQDDENLKSFTTMCHTPPYPDVLKICNWLTSGQLQAQYTEFSLKPYGVRRLDYAFNLSKYEIQRSKFVDHELIFTEEVGRNLERELQNNRLKSISELLDEYHGLSKEALSHEDKLKLICLCVEMLARTTSQLSHDASPTQISQELNTTQIMALYAKMVNPNTRLISQIDTGEGKSRIMMILAACQAAQGKTVDFLTSDMQLAERDYLSYKQFFTSLGISSSLISLNTPSQLYQKSGVNFSDNNQLVLLRNKSDIDRQPFAYLDERPNKRCLLIDEVDKFIHDKSKDSYNYASQSKQLKDFIWIYPQLINFVQSLSLEPNAPFDPNAHMEGFIEYVNANVTNRIHKASLAQLAMNYPEQINTWLRSANTALEMEADKHYIMTKSNKDKLYLLRDSEGNKRYSRKIFVLDNGRPVEGSSFSDGVHQCLCAKENIHLQKLENHTREAFMIIPENETQRSSYTVTFMDNYHQGSIYGVSGTTRSEAPLHDQEINYENYAYLTVPREKPLIRDDKNVWLAKDEAQQISFIKRAITKKLRDGCPALIICKDDQQSLRLYQALKKDKVFKKQVNKLLYIHGLTTKEDENKAIKKAGIPKNITISTAGMLGRGVDINSENLLVLAAYVPTIEDEIQIKGRSARIGKPGEYRMIPNMSDADYPLNGYTHNVHNEVIKSQKIRQSTAAFQKEVSSLYAFFLEDMTKQFLKDCERFTDAEWLSELKTWQDYLGQMQKAWEPCRQELLDAIERNDEAHFIRKFNDFTTRWQRTERHTFQKTNIEKVLLAIKSQQRFFVPQREPIKVQRDYDPSDDGQARVYSTLFAKTRATLRGERRMFADYHAWREGRGCLFPDLMAVLNGERDLFANLYATIARWIKELSEWLAPTSSTTQVNDFSLEPTFGT